jgi:glucosamine-6-phosphate deaminase
MSQHSQFTHNRRKGMTKHTVRIVALGLALSIAIQPAATAIPKNFPTPSCSISTSAFDQEALLLPLAITMLHALHPGAFFNIFHSLKSSSISLGFLSAHAVFAIPGGGTNRPTLKVEPDYEALSQSAAKEVISTIREKSNAVLLMPTGDTPLRLYQLIIEKAWSREINLNDVTMFMLDEYVGGDDYSDYIHQNFINQLPFHNRPNVHVLNGMATDEKVELARYERLIVEAGGVDLAVLGVGTEGHIGFNEKWTSFLQHTWKTPLSPSTIKRNLSKMKRPYTHALTVGIKTILESKRIILLANGPEKATPINELMTGQPREEWPVTALLLHGDVTVIVDESSAPPNHSQLVFMEPELNRQNRYAKSLRNIVESPAITKASWHGRRLLREIGPDVEMMVQGVYTNPQIKIALEPVGSTLMGYADTDASDVESDICVLAGLEDHPPMIIGDEAMIIRFNLNRLIDSAGRAPDPYTVDRPILNYSSTHLESMLQLRNLDTIFLPAVYGDADLVDSARRRIVTMLSQHSEGEYAWTKIQGNFQTRVYVQDPLESEKPHEARWLREQHVQNVDTFNRERSIDLPSLSEMTSIMGLVRDGPFVEPLAVLVELGGTHLRGAVMLANGDLIFSPTEPMPPLIQGTEILLSKIVDVFGQLRRNHFYESAPLRAEIVTPGIVENGFIRLANNLALTGIHLKDEMEARLQTLWNTPVTVGVTNDLVAAAMAELDYWKGQFLYVQLGTGSSGLYAASGIPLEPLEIGLRKVHGLTVESEYKRFKKNQQWEALADLMAPLLQEYATRFLVHEIVLGGSVATQQPEIIPALQQRLGSKFNLIPGHFKEDERGLRGLAHILLGTGVMILLTVLLKPFNFETPLTLPNLSAGWGNLPSAVGMLLFRMAYDLPSTSPRDVSLLRSA